MIHNPSYILSKLYYLTFNPSYSQSVINSELAKLGLKKKNTFESNLMLPLVLTLPLHPTLKLILTLILNLGLR